MIVYECLYGIAHTIFGGKVEFGSKGICAYTQEVYTIVILNIRYCYT